MNYWTRLFSHLLNLALLSKYGHLSSVNFNPFYLIRTPPKHFIYVRIMPKIGFSFWLHHIWSIAREIRCWRTKKPITVYVNITISWSIAVKETFGPLNLIRGSPKCYRLFTTCQRMVLVFDCLKFGPLAVVMGTGDSNMPITIYALIATRLTDPQFYN